MAFLLCLRKAGAVVSDRVPRRNGRNLEPGHPRQRHILLGGHRAEIAEVRRKTIERVFGFIPLPLIRSLFKPTSHDLGAYPSLRMCQIGSSRRERVRLGRMSLCGACWASAPMF